MLYPRWLETARSNANRIAVIDGATKEAISFEDLARRAAAMPEATGPVLARGGDLQFLLEVLRAWRDNRPVVPIDRDAPEPAIPRDVPPSVVLVKQTPGSTVRPRSIFFGAEALVADAARLVTAMDLSPARTNLAVISLAHSYGFSNLVLPLLLHGIPMHAVPVPYPHMVAEAMACHEALTVPAVPSIWRAWFRSGVLATAPIAVAISAAASLPLALEQEMHAATGIKLRNFYGASECGGISFDSSSQPRDDPADVGSALDGVAVSRHSSGRLLIESDAVGLRYDVPPPDDPLRDGCFLTPDLGRLDGRRVFLEGRVGDDINVAGRKTSPARIESALLATGIPSRVRVFGVPSANPDRVESIVAMVDLPPDSNLADLKHAAFACLAPWENPRQWCPNPSAETWALSLAALRQRFASNDHRRQRQDL